MTSVILRRSSSVISCRFFASLASVKLFTHHCRLTVLQHDGFSDGVGVKSLHEKSEPLNFHSLSVSRAAQLVVECDYSNEEVGSDMNNDEGLKIAKFDISREIVDALARKGIVKLFPILVATTHNSCAFKTIGGREFRFLVERYQISLIHPSVVGFQCHRNHHQQVDVSETENVAYESMKDALD